MTVAHGAQDRVRGAQPGQVPIIHSADAGATPTGSAYCVGGVDARRQVHRVRPRPPDVSHTVGKTGQKLTKL